MFKQFLADIREINEYMRDSYTVIVSSIKIRLLVFMADLLQKTHNRRFFVSIIVKPQGERLKIFDKYMFKSYKRKGWMPKRMTTLELEQQCFYATPLKRNNNVSKDERKKAIKQYTQYSKMIRKVQRIKT